MLEIRYTNQWIKFHSEPSESTLDKLSKWDILFTRRNDGGSAKNKQRPTTTRTAKRAKQPFFFLHVHLTFCTSLCRWPLLHNARKNLPTFDKIERHRIRAMNIETAWIHFLRDVFAPSSSSLLKLMSFPRGTLTCVLSMLRRKMPQNTSLAPSPKCHGLWY